LLDYDFEESIACWVVMTARAFEQALNEELEPLGITYRQWQVLGWLAFERELAQSELAERMRVEAPTLVGILDRMERDGWIVRESSAADRRKKLVRPTERVRPVWDQVTAAARRVRSRATAGLTPEEQVRLKEGMKHIQSNLSTPSRSAKEAS
jgi:MarR family transcriptional regulator for hemolysin